MNVIPAAPAPAAVPTTSTGTPATSSEPGLAETFAALVDALTAGLTATDAAGADEVVGEDVEETETSAEEGGDAPAPAEVLSGTQPVPIPLAAPAPAPTGAPVTATPAVPGGEAAPVAIDGEGEQPSAELPLDLPPAGTAEGAEAPTPVTDAPTPDSADVPMPLDDAPDGALPLPEAEAVPVDAGAPASPTAPVATTDGGDAPLGPANGVTAPTPTATADDVQTAAPVRPATPSLPDQLVEVIGPLRRGPDGTHRLALQLHPEELGEVLVDVRVRGNEISLSIRTDLAGTADLLRDAVSDLRHQLEAAGFRSGDVDVSGRSDRGPNDDGRPTSTTNATSSETAGAGPDGDADATTSPAAVTSGLDLRL